MSGKLTVVGIGPGGYEDMTGRAGESWELLFLSQLRDYPADMFCTVFAGSSATRVIGGKPVTPRGYRDV